MILRKPDKSHYLMWCPGCDEAHVINDTWQFDGNMERPTFSPSILTYSGHYAPGFKPGSDCWCTYYDKHPDKEWHFECRRCHSFVRDGQWQFLDDCSHSE